MKEGVVGMIVFVLLFLYLFGSSEGLKIGGRELIDITYRQKLNSNDYTLSLVLMVRIWPDRDLALENMGRLIEFLEYYQLLGVEHFYIYDDAGDEKEYFGNHPVIRYYQQQDIVTYHVIQEGPSYRTWSNARQDSVYALAIQNYKVHNKWMLILDMDEFIYFTDPEETLITFLRKELPRGWDSDTPETTQFLFACWFVSGYLEDPQNPHLRLVEQYLWREKTAIPFDRRTKMMAWINDFSRFGNVHRMMMRVGHTVEVPLSRAFFLHYWKHRMDLWEPEKLDYFPHMAHRYGRILADNIESLAHETGMPIGELRAGPFPHTQSQNNFDPGAALKFLNFNASSPLHEPDTVEVLSSIRARIQALKQKKESDRKNRK